jgi:hypothetical protein
METETVTCQVCGATAIVRDSGGRRSTERNLKEMRERCQNWPPPKVHGLVTGCEHLDQAAMMARARARRVRPLRS